MAKGSGSEDTLFAVIGVGVALLAAGVIWMFAKRRHKKRRYSADLEDLEYSHAHYQPLDGGESEDDMPDVGSEYSWDANGDNNAVRRLEEHEHKSWFDFLREENRHETSAAELVAPDSWHREEALRNGTDVPDEFKESDMQLPSVNDHPDDWREKFDKATGKVYYWNDVTQQTQWEPPAGSKFVSSEEVEAKQWVKRFDNNNARVYYWNMETNEAQWDAPEGFDDPHQHDHASVGHWLRHEVAGVPFYFNETTKESAWTSPALFNMAEDYMYTPEEAASHFPDLFEQSKPPECDLEESELPPMEGLAGELLKSDPKFKKFKHRFCVLSKQFLMYYKAASDLDHHMPPKGVIDLTLCHIFDGVDFQPLVKSKLGGKENSFCLKVYGRLFSRTYVFRCMSQEDKSEWFEALQSAILYFKDKPAVEFPDLEVMIKNHWKKQYTLVYQDQLTHYDKKEEAQAGKAQAGSVDFHSANIMKKLPTNIMKNAGFYVVGIQNTYAGGYAHYFKLKSAEDKHAFVQAIKERMETTGRLDMQKYFKH